MDFRNLTASASGTNASSYTTASVSPTPGSSLIIVIESDIGAGAPTVPSVSGLSLGWFQIEDCYYDQTGTTYRLTVFISSPVSQAGVTGIITIDYGGVTQGGASWIVDEILSADTNGSLVTQWAKSAEPGSGATSITLGLADALSEGGAVWACASWVAQETATVPDGWTILAQANHANPAASIISACNTQQGASATFTWSTSAPKGAIIMEINGVVPEVLHAIEDDWHLRADGDTERSAGQTFVYEYYLTDTAGNRLTDPSGNYLVARNSETKYPQVLHALPDDFTLRTE